MASQAGPPGYDPELDAKPKTKSVKRNERKKEKRLQVCYFLSCCNCLNFMVLFLLSRIHLSFVYHCGQVLLGLGIVLKRRIGFFFPSRFFFNSL
jgi:hypothetical protein